MCHVVAAPESYVPLHFAWPVDGVVEAVAAVRVPLVEAGRPGRRHLHVGLGVGMRGQASGLVPLAYSEALHGHRGCKSCWQRWEEQQMCQAFAAEDAVDIVVHCPVCHLLVDVRKAYDSVLCLPCQRSVVLSEQPLRPFARARAFALRWKQLIGVLALFFLFAVFGLQSLVMTLAWEVFDRDLSKNLGGNFTANSGQVPLIPSRSTSRRRGAEGDNETSPFVVYGPLLAELLQGR